MSSESEKTRKMKMLKMSKKYLKCAGSATLEHTCYALINRFTLQQWTQAVSLSRFCLFSLAFILEHEFVEKYNLVLEMNWIFIIQPQIAGEREYNTSLSLSSNFHINTTSREVGDFSLQKYLIMTIEYMYYVAICFLHLFGIAYLMRVLQLNSRPIRKSFRLGSFPSRCDRRCWLFSVLVTVMHPMQPHEHLIHLWQFRIRHWS